MLHQRKPLKQRVDKEHRYSEEAFGLLPAPISAIQVQKKNKNRFSIFVEDEFLIGVSDAVLTKYNLYKGTEITPSLLQQILDAENKWAVREYFIRLLGRRDHSRKELQTKAYRKGFTGDFVTEILDELEQKNYVDDQKFAGKFISDKLEFNSWGPFKIKSELQKKGVKASVADNLIRERFGEEDICESMKQLIIKKKNRFQREPEEKRRKKVFDFLMRKGYNSNSILSYMDELLKEISA